MSPRRVPFAGIPELPVQYPGHAFFAEQGDQGGPAPERLCQQQLAAKIALPMNLGIAAVAIGLFPREHVVVEIPLLAEGGILNQFVNEGARRSIRRWCAWWWAWYRRRQVRDGGMLITRDECTTRPARTRAGPAGKAGGACR